MSRFYPTFDEFHLVKEGNKWVDLMILAIQMVCLCRWVVELIKECCARLEDLGSRVDIYFYDFDE